MHPHDSERGSTTKREAPASVTPLEGGILGLLARTEPLSGWDIQKQARTSVAYFWPLGRSQIYAALPRLERRGLVEGRAVRQVSKPDKRLYRLTTAGRRMLAQWLDAGETRRTADLFLLKLFFSAHANRSAVRARVVERRAEALRLTDEIEQMSDSPDIDDFFHRLTRDYGLITARCVAAWCDQSLAAIDAFDQERSSP